MSEKAQEYKIEGRPSTIFHTVKNKDNPYVMIDRRPIDNPNLSFKAKGLLTYLMSRPDGWEVSVSDLFKHAKDGEDAIRSGLAELRAAGHMKYSQTRQAGRITGMLIEVYEIPDISPHADFPDVEKPDTEKPDVENPTQVLKTLSITDSKQYKGDEPKFLDPVTHLLDFTKTKAPAAELSLEIESVLKVEFGMDATTGKGGIEFVNAAVKHTMKDGQHYRVFLDWWRANYDNRKYWTFPKMRENWPGAFMEKNQNIVAPDGNFYA